MESAKLEIIIHYGKDLKDVKHLSPMDPYVIVWIAGDGKESKQITPVSENGGCNPSWKCSMNFDIDSMSKEYILFFQIKHGGKLFNRNIGEVQVRFADLLATDAPGDKVSYPVTTQSGEKEGELIVSHKFSEFVVRSDDDDGADNCNRKVVAGSPEKKKPGTGKKIAHKATQTLAFAGIEAGIAYVTEMICDC